MINHKLTEKIYREEGLALRRKRRRKRAAGVRCRLPSGRIKVEYGFRYDSIVTGRLFRALAIVDDIPESVRLLT